MKQPGIRNSGNPVPSINAIEIILKQLENLNHSLKNPVLIKSIPLKTVLPPLNEILLLLGKSSLDPLDTDVLLIKNFLGSWLKKYSDLLPRKQKKELVALKNLLESMRMDKKGEEESRIFFGNMTKLEKDRPEWKLTINRRKGDSGKSEEDEKVECILDLSFLRLGTVKVVLSREKERFFCRFYSSQALCRQSIRKSMTIFREHLLESGIELPLFRISPRIPDRLVRPVRQEKGIELWG